MFNFIRNIALGAAIGSFVYICFRGLAAMGEPSSLWLLTTIGVM